MWFFSETRTMQVEEVHILKGLSGKELLYLVRLIPVDGKGLAVEVDDWGRDLKVPQSGQIVRVSASRRAWKNICGSEQRELYIEMHGLSHIIGPKIETGFVGRGNYHDILGTMEETAILAA